MKSFRWVSCSLVVLGLGWGAGEARAQLQDLTVPPPPGLSPFLNLFRQGASPTLNYFDIVRPQLQNQAALQGLQQQQTVLQQQVRQTTPQTASGQGTAKVPGYMTHGKYFGTNGTIAAGNGPTRRSLSDRHVNTGSTQNQTPAGAGVPTTTGVTGAQTRTVIGPNTPSLGPTYINPYGAASNPFNPYRGF